MTVADTVRLHWPTRDRLESQQALSRIVDRWRFRVGLKYHAQHAMLQRILKHPVELAEFDAVMRESE
jgi:hypothetical protein